MSEQSGVSACEPSPIYRQALRQQVSGFSAQTARHDVQLAICLTCYMSLRTNAWAHRCHPEAVHNVVKCANDTGDSLSDVNMLLACILTWYNGFAEYTPGSGGGMGVMRSQLYQDGMNALWEERSHSNTYSTRTDSRCKGDQQYVGLTVVGRRIVAAQAFPSRWRRGHVGRSLANDHSGALLFLSTPPSRANTTTLS